MNRPNRILVTGAAGIVGSALRPLLASRYEAVLLTDREPIENLAANESFVCGDIEERAFVGHTVAQVDGIVHLAGMVGASYSFDEVLGPNIVGTHHVFSSAHEHGVSHVVYASSHHTVGFLRCGSHIDATTAHRPNSEYAVSKAFGESAGAYFADNFGLNILSIRIGYVGDEVTTKRRLHTWISARDLSQLVAVGLETPDYGYQIVYGVSDNPEPYFDNANAFRLGYQPQDRSIDHIASPDVLDRVVDLQSIEGGVVGGGFASVGFAGNVKRILEGSDSTR